MEGAKKKRRTIRSGFNKKTCKKAFIIKYFVNFSKQMIRLDLFNVGNVKFVLTINIYVFDFVV